MNIKPIFKTDREERAHKFKKSTYVLKSKDEFDDKVKSLLGVITSGKLISVEWIGGCAPTELMIYELLVEVIYNDEYLLEKFRELQVIGNWEIQELNYGAYKFCPNIFNNYNFNVSNKKLYISSQRKASGRGLIFDNWTVEEIMIFIKYMSKRASKNVGSCEINEVSDNTEKFCIDMQDESILKALKLRGKEKSPEEERIEPEKLF